MKKLNNYITEAWSGVKQQANIENIKSWCEEMGIENYTINSKGEIDVDGSVLLTHKDFKELPHKFGTVRGSFVTSINEELISLKNCPDKVGTWFNCSHNPKLNSLEGCPKEVGKNFYCGHCKRNFTEKEVQIYCNVKNKIYL